MSRPVLFDLRDRVILITGAASGIGLDTARRAAARGARIALVDIDADAAQRAAASIGARAAAFTADVTDRDALATAVDDAVARFGGIDAVVVNAGVPPVVGSVLAVDEGAWERVLEINLSGAYRTIKATLPHVVERRGHILLVASAYAFAPGVAVSCYAASKAGVEALGRALRIELEPHA